MVRWASADTHGQHQAHTVNAVRAYVGTCILLQHGYFVVSPFTRPGGGPIRRVKPRVHTQAGHSSYLYTYLYAGAKDGTDRAASMEAKMNPDASKDGDHATTVTGQKVSAIFLFSSLFFEGLE